MANNKYPCTEYTIEVIHHEYRVRLWIDANGEIPENFEPPNFNNYVDAVWDFFYRYFDLKKIVEVLASLPNVNAIQIIADKDRDDVKTGFMVYSVPFTEKEYTDCPEKRDFNGTTFYCIGEAGHSGKHTAMVNSKLRSWVK